MNNKGAHLSRGHPYEAFIRANNKDAPFIHKMLRVPGFVGPLPPTAERRSADARTR